MRQLVIILLAVLIGAASHSAGQDSPPTSAPIVTEVKPIVAGSKAKIEPLKLSPGKFRALVIKDYVGPVTWDITPADLREKLISYEVLPKGTKIHGWHEDDDAARLHTFPDTGSDLLYIRGQDNASGSVTVAAWGVKEGQAVKLCEQVIEIGGPRPPPPPDPDVKPVVPDSRFGLTKFAFEQATLKVTGPNRSAQAKVLAQAYRTVATDAHRGMIKSAEDVLRTAKSRADAALGAESAAWDAFGNVLQNELYRLYQERKLIRVADYADALAELATGLESIK